MRARIRRNLEPASPPARPDVARALHAALSVYYFPGMWDWDLSMTLPLVLQGFDRDLRRQWERAGPAAAEHDWTQPRRRRPGPAAASRPLVAQHEPSGGGRSIPTAPQDVCLGQGAGRGGADRAARR
jgi:hypothetical protein